LPHAANATKSPPCVKEGGSRRLTGGLFCDYNPSTFFALRKSIYTREPSAAAGIGITKAFYPPATPENVLCKPKDPAAPQNSRVFVVTHLQHRFGTSALPNLQHFLQNQKIS